MKKNKKNIKFLNNITNIIKNHYLNKGFLGIKYANPDQDT